jgi:hypothetical protein
MVLSRMGCTLLSSWISQDTASLCFIPSDVYDDSCYLCIFTFELKCF